MKDVSTSRRRTSVWVVGLAVLTAAAALAAGGCAGKVPLSRKASSAAGQPVKPLSNDMVSRLSRLEGRAEAIDDLAASGRKDIAKYLVPFLEDKDPKVRLAAARGLRKVADVGAVMSLAARLTAERQGDIREEIAAALEKIDNAAARTALAMVGNDRDAKIREFAARAAQKIADSKPKERPPGAPVVEEAARAVEAARSALVAGRAPESDAGAVRGVLGLLGDPNEAVAEMALAHARGFGRLAAEVYLGVKTPPAGTLRMLKLLGEMADPNLVAVVLDVAARGATAEAELPAEQHKAAVEAIALLGEKAVGPLDRSAVQAYGRLGWKKVAADVFARTRSDAAAAAIVERIGHWRKVADPDELALWRETLRKMATPAAKEAMAKIEAHLARCEALAGAPEARPLPETLPTADGLSGVTGDRDVVLTLKGALLGADLHVTLECRGGKWPTTGWGFGCNYDKADHDVTVREVKVAADGVAMDLSIEVQGDAWTFGGPGHMRVGFGKTADGWSGTYSGSFRGRPCKGDVAVAIEAPVRVFAHEPLKPREHPRLSGRQPNWREPRQTMTTEAGNHMMYQAAHPPLPWNAADSDGPIVAAAMMYDHAYYQADPELRRQTAASLIKFGRNLYKGMSAPWHNWQGHWRTGTAVAALAVLGDPVDYPPEPPDEPVTDIPPATGYDVPAGVPVIELNGGSSAVRTEVSSRWLLAGPLPLSEKADYLAALGGAGKARPAPGTKIGKGDQQAEFRAFECGNVGGALRMIDLEPLLKGKRGQVFYLYAVSDSLFARTVRVRCGGRVWIAGRAVTNEQVLCLGVGKYPVLMEARISNDLPPFSPASADLPQLLEMPHPREVRRKWEEEKRYWESNGQASPEAARLLKLGEMNLRRYIHWALGDCGFNCEKETYTASTMDAISPFLTAYFDCFGANLVWGSRAEGLPLRHKAATLNGRSVIGGFYGGHSYLSLVQPSIRKALEATTPAEFPNFAVRDRRMAGYVFRNGWKDADDIFMVIEGKGVHLRAAHTNFQIGTFRIYGLGSAWAIHSSEGRDAPLEHHNVLLLPDDPANMTLGAKEAHWQAGQDGSGAVTLDMNDPYMGREPSAGNLVDWEGKVRRETLRDLGIRGVRAFAVDFSGASGAPGLFAVADKVAGGGRKEWTMHPATGAVETRGNTFLLRSAGGATLKGTFLAPADVKLAVEKRMEPYPRPGDTKTGKDGKPRGPVRKPAQVLVATGPDGKAGDFFVVMTLQKGQPPAIEVRGNGLDAVAAVGKQTIRFDGRKVVIATK